MGSLWNRSGTIERLGDDVVAAGAQAFFFAGGTTTPFTVYQDAAESAAHPHPLLANAHGRWPDVFVPYTVSYDVQVKSSGGEQLTYTLRVPNPDPVDLSVTIPAQNQVQTGMIHGELVPGTTVRAGFVRLNGLTIGTAASLATERANGVPPPGDSDTRDLFYYLWNNLTNAIAPVSGGRGGTAAADFAANKTITLPDCRGTGFTGLDDMGNAALGAFAGLTFTTGSATTAGSYIGANKYTLAANQLASHTHPSGTTSINGAHTHTGTTSGTNQGAHQHEMDVALSGNTSGQRDVTNVAYPHYHTHSGIPTGFSSTGGYSYVTGSYVTTGPTGTTSTGVQEFYPAAGETSADHLHTWGSSGTFYTKVSPATVYTGTHSHSFTTDVGTPPNEIGKHSHTFDVGSNVVPPATVQPINNLPLKRLVTWYIKL